MKLPRLRRRQPRVIDLTHASECNYDMRRLALDNAWRVTDDADSGQLTPGALIAKAQVIEGYLRGTA